MSDGDERSDRPAVPLPDIVREELPPDLLEPAPTEREILRRELDEAIRQRRSATGWLVTVGVGPAAIIAVLLALFVEGSRDLAIAFGLLGAAILCWRVYRADKRVEELERALEDPMDGS